MSAILRQGQRSPDAYELLALTGTSGLDMTTVSAAVIHVQKPDSSELAWTANLSGATTAQVLLTYPFTGTSELTIPGKWKAYARLTVSGGFMLTDVAEIWVKAAYEV